MNDEAAKNETKNGPADAKGAAAQIPAGSGDAQNKPRSADSSSDQSDPPGETGHPPRTFISLAGVVAYLRSRTPPFWQASFSALLVVNAGLQIYFLSQTLKNTTNANQTAVQAVSLARENFLKDQRPYLWLTNNFGVPGYIEEFRFPAWPWHYTNYGRTPANNVHITASMNVGENALTAARPFEPSKRAAPIPPGKDDFSTAIAKQAMPKSELLRLLKNVDGSALVYGRINYTDAAGTPYETGFCFYGIKTGAIAYCTEDGANYIK
jgi:hypothetical protein